MTAHGAVRFTIDQSVLRVERLEARRERRQGLVIDADDEFTIEDTTATRVVLWADRAPHTVDIEVDAPCEIRCWNVWDDDGVVQAWLGEAHITVDLDETEDDDPDGDDPDDDDDDDTAPRLDEPLVLSCHDGHADDDGPDLVVRLNPGGE